MGHSSFCISDFGDGDESHLGCLGILNDLRALGLSTSSSSSAIGSRVGRDVETGVDSDTNTRALLASAQLDLGLVLHGIFGVAQSGVEGSDVALDPLNGRGDSVNLDGFRSGSSVALEDIGDVTDEVVSLCCFCLS